MINILVDSRHPELVIPATVFIYQNRGKYRDEQFSIIPVQASDLDTDFLKVYQGLDRELTDLAGGQPFSQSRGGENKFIIFGIYPENKKEEQKIAYFFDKHSDNIVLWLDNHLWPGNLLRFLTSQNPEVKMDNTKTILELYAQVSGIEDELNDEWLEIEEALKHKNINQPLAGRFLKNFRIFEEYLSDSLSARAELFLLSNSIAIELLSGEENLGLTEGENMYDKELRAQYNFSEKFSDSLPILSEAKKAGRSIGFLWLDKPPAYLNAQEIIDQGLKRFPWLCVLGFKINNTNHIWFGSKVVPLIRGSARGASVRNVEKFLRVIQLDILKMK